MKYTLTNENLLIHSDCLLALKQIPSQSIDLVYIDPPFFSNANYEIIWGDEGEVRSFNDRWSGGIYHYIAWLYERVKEIHRILKPSGSLFLHCDYHANAYIRVEILDKLFGYENFKNEIIWKRSSGAKTSQYQKKSYGRVMDTIYWYSKHYAYTKAKIGKILLSDEVAIDRFNKVDEKGRKYKLDKITLSLHTRRVNLIYEYKGYIPEHGWSMKLEKLSELDNQGKLYWNERGTPYRKVFLDEYEGINVDCLWNDIHVVSGDEKIGYPTQKPEKLLRRIIESHSDVGDTVLDCFLGGGTTAVASEKLDRRWIGIDQSVVAIKVTQARLDNNYIFGNKYRLITDVYNYQEVFNMDAFVFEKFIVTEFGGVANEKQRGDYGIDGLKDNIPIQVKQSENIGRNVIDNFLSAINRYDKNQFEKCKTDKTVCGYIIAFSFGKGLIEERARLEGDGIIIKLIKVSEIISLQSPPIFELEFDKDNHTVRVINAQNTNSTYSNFYQWCYPFTDKFVATVFKDNQGIFHLPKKHHDNYKGTTIVCRGTNSDGVSAEVKMAL